MEHHKNSKKHYIIVLGLILLFCNEVSGQSFSPPLITFEGYLHEIYSSKIWFKVLTQNKQQVFSFKYDIKTKSFYWQDSNVMMVFYGSGYPATCSLDLKHLYHGRSSSAPFDYQPEIGNDKEHTFINPMDSLTYFHDVTRKRVCFTAYDYEYYKKYDTCDCTLKGFGIYTYNAIYPSMVKTKNKTFIVNYFYKK